VVKRALFARRHLNGWDSNVLYKYAQSFRLQSSSLSAWTGMLKAIHGCSGFAVPNGTQPTGMLQPCNIRCASFVGVAGNGAKPKLAQLRYFNTGAGQAETHSLARTETMELAASRALASRIVSASESQVSW
jgi:hypothetical protein